MSNPPHCALILQFYVYKFFIFVCVDKSFYFLFVVLIYHHTCPIIP